MLQVGDILVGRYEIEALLGEGGMGAVFRAFDILDQRRVAVKEFRLGDLPSAKDSAINPDGTRGKQKKTGHLTREDALKLFKKEALLLRPLQHPNLPQVFNFFIIGSEAYIIMTLIEGISLADLLEKNGGPLPEEQIAGWLIQVLGALQYCHDKGVVHRDLKPENLLLRDDGQIYLIDFGIAKALNPGQQATSTGMRILSPGYAPPEQYSAREGSADPRTDLYSLGAVAYTLLTGQIPTEATERMVGEALPIPHNLNPAISPRMEAFILKCLEIRKEDRPQNAAEVAAALAPARSGTTSPRKIQTAPVHSPPSTAPKSGPRSVPKPRVKVPWGKMLAALGSAALLGLLIWLTSWKIIPTISDTILDNQATRTAIAATQGQMAIMSELTTVWTQIPMSTFEPTITMAPTLPFTPASTSTFTYAPTSTPTSSLVTPDCATKDLKWVSPMDGMTLLCVPESLFSMGNETYPIYRPVHSVWLDAFWIDQTEVTNSQYSLCVDAGECNPPKSDLFLNENYANHPVLTLNWYDAESYCSWAGRALPSEAQWEKAARSSDERTYPWGNTFSSSNLNSSLGYDGYSESAPVGSFPSGASPFGALDMAGNAWEWVADWYKSGYETPASLSDWLENPTGPVSGTSRVLRGGSWNSKGSALTTFSRSSKDPSTSSFDTGFRCAYSQP